MARRKQLKLQCPKCSQGFIAVIKGPIPRRVKCSNYFCDHKVKTNHGGHEEFPECKGCGRQHKNNPCEFCNNEIKQPARVKINIAIYRIVKTGKKRKRTEYETLRNVTLPVYRFTSITSRMVLDVVKRRHKGWLTIGWARATKKKVRKS